MTTVLVTGTFDGLHPGHEDLFRQAKEHGDHLVVVVARDETVAQVKGRAPRIGEEERRKAVEASPLVGQAVLGREGDKLAVIADLKPDVIVLGYDQEAFTDNLEAQLKDRGVTVRLVRAKPFHPEKYKSSLMATEAKK